MNSRNFVVIVSIFLITSTFFMATANAQDFFSQIMENIRQWFESSPFGNIFSSPLKSTERLSLAFYIDDFSLEIPKPVNITTNTSRIKEFTGTLEVSKKENVAYFNEESGLVIEQKIDYIEIENLVIPSYQLTDKKLEIMSGNWNENTDNGWK